MDLPTQTSNSIISVSPYATVGASSSYLPGKDKYIIYFDSSRNIFVALLVVIWLLLCLVALLVYRYWERKREKKMRDRTAREEGFAMGRFGVGGSV